MCLFIVHVNDYLYMSSLIQSQVGSKQFQWGAFSSLPFSKTTSVCMHVYVHAGAPKQFVLRAGGKRNKMKCSESGGKGEGGVALSWVCTC